MEAPRIFASELIPRRRNTRQRHRRRVASNSLRSSCSGEGSSLADVRPMDPTKIRFSYLLGIIFAAVLTAGVLRHVLHVGVGFTRKEILAGALLAAATTIFLTVAFFRWNRRP